MTDLQSYAHLITGDIDGWLGFIRNWAYKKADETEDWADVGDLKYVLNVLSLLESFLGGKPIKISTLKPFQDIVSRAEKGGG